jgi:hypothetical protein
MRIKATKNAHDMALATRTAWKGTTDFASWVSVSAVSRVYQPLCPEAH